MYWVDVNETTPRSIKGVELTVDSSQFVLYFNQSSVSVTFSRNNEGYSTFFF